jgi:DNA-binding response OmpR family regulator
MRGEEEMRLLLVEDDASLRETLSESLRREGFEVIATGDGGEALELARTTQPDLIILDLMLPTLDGLSVCRILRKETDVPILMLTARSGPVDRVVGLEMGADDYVVKPFHMGELLARIRALLRRARGRPATTLTAGDLTLDLLARKAFRGGRELRLTMKEFDLLATLIQHRGRVLSRAFLLERVWGLEHPVDTRTVDTHIRWLREKIEEDPTHPRRIVTVRGIGYRFEG